MAESVDQAWVARFSRLRGHGEAVRSPRPPLLIALLAIVVAGATDAQETSDAAPGSGCTVLIDVAHYNVAFPPTARAALASWLEGIGCVTRELSASLDSAALAGVDVFLSKNPVAEKHSLPPDPTAQQVAEAWRLPALSAFSRSETELLRGWVEDGGGLLLVVDHMPMPGAIDELAGAFGIEVSNGFAVDEASLEGLTAPEVAHAGALVFRRTRRPADDTRAIFKLADHPLTNGGGPAEAVDSVVTHVGSAFRLPPDGYSLLTLSSSAASLLPEVAWEFSEDTPRLPVPGWSQGGVLRRGLGALAIFGDGALLVPPEAAAAGDDPELLQNARLLENAVRWLTATRVSATLSGGSDAR